MRLARKLFLLVAMMFAAAALAAPSALAQNEPVEVESEQTEEHCPDTVAVVDHEASGGCFIHAESVGDIELSLLVESPFSEVWIHGLGCGWEFDVNVGPDGEGWISHQEITPGGQGCGIIEGIEACFEEYAEEPIPWHLQLHERMSDGGVEGAAEICLQSANAGHVEGEVIFDLPPNGNHYDAAETQSPRSPLIDHESQFNPGVHNVGFIGHWEFHEDPETGSFPLEIFH